MRKLILLFLISLPFLSYSQGSKYYIRTDTLVVEKVGGAAELMLKNATRDSTGGVIQNIGGGRTRFVKVRAINDSAFTIGTDTVVIRGAAGGASDGNNFPSSLSFNSSTGVFTLNRTDLSALTVDLDGRYAQSATKRNDSVFVIKDGTEVFAYLDTATTALSAGYLLQAPTSTSVRVDPLKVEAFDYFVGGNGNDANPGTAEFYPKQTINGVESVASATAGELGKATTGLRGGDKFYQTFDAFEGARLKSYKYGLDGLSFAKISGMDIVTGWTGTSGQANVYEKDITHSINTSNPGYHYIFVAEIDTLLEKIYPFRATKYLPLATSLSNCNSTDGSFYMDGLDASTETIYINPTGSAAPGSNKYRYEVVTRAFDIDGTNGGAITTSSYRRGVFENLIVQSSAHGYGMIGAGDSTIIRRVIFWGGGTHSAVIANGYVGRSLFLPGPRGLDQGEIPLVFYKPNQDGAYSHLYGSIFLDTYSGPYAHDAGTGATHQKKVTFEGNYVFGTLGYTTNAFGGDLIDTVVVQDNYAENVHKTITGVGTDYIVKGNVFNGFYGGKSGVDNPTNLTVRALLYNNLFKTTGDSTNQSSLDYATAYYFVNSNVSLRANNNIFHLKTEWTGQGNPVNLFSTLPASTKFKYNIIICDVPTGHRASIISIDRNAQGNFEADSNVYVIVRGDGFYWTVTNPIGGDPNILTLEDWTTEVGDDANSIVIDLRDNPNGINDLFIDAANGNYNFANTAEADTVRSLFAGMITPPRAFPRKPSPDEAAQTVMNDEIVSPNISMWQWGEGAAQGGSSSSGEVNTASNVGTGDGVFKQKTGVDLEFKSIEHDNTISVVNNTNDLTLKVDSAVMATKWYAASLGGGSGWALGGNSLSGTTDIGALTNHNVRIITNNIQRGAWTNDGKWLWNVPLGTESANYNAQLEGSMSIGGNAISQTGFLLQNVITATANSQQLYGMQIVPGFSTGGFSGITASVLRAEASFAGDLTMRLFNTNASNDAIFQVLGANGSVNVSSYYGLYFSGGPGLIHSLNGQYLSFNVGLFDEKMVIDENALRLTAGRYLNFGATSGTSGYGLFDNGGAIEIKHSGGTWSPVVGTTTTQTLTNKTLTSPQINFTSDADYDLITRISGVTSRFAKGSANQVLAMNSGATAFAWTTPSNPNLSVVTSDPDDVTLASDMTILPDLTGVASKQVTLPSAASNVGKVFWVWNTNASGFNWSFAAAITLPDGTTSSTIANGKMYQVFSNGSVWVKMNEQ